MIFGYSERGVKHLVAYVTPEYMDPQEVMQWGRKKLPQHAVPAFVTPLPHLPSLPNGKIDWRSLPQPNWGGNGDDSLPLSLNLSLSLSLSLCVFPISDTDEVVAPRTELEGRILDLYTDVLHVDNIGVKSDFFVVGGNSLLAGAFMSKPREYNSASLPTWLIFAHM